MLYEFEETEDEFFDKKSDSLFKAPLSEKVKYGRADIPPDKRLNGNDFSIRTFLDLSNASEEQLHNLKSVETFNSQRKEKGKLAAMMNSQWKIHLYRSMGVPMKRFTDDQCKE